MLTVYAWHSLSPTTYLPTPEQHHIIKQHVSPPAENKFSEETFKTSNFLLNLISSHTVLII